MTPAELEEGKRLLVLAQRYEALGPRVACPPELADGHEAFGAWLMKHGAELVNAAGLVPELKRAVIAVCEVALHRPMVFAVSPGAIVEPGDASGVMWKCDFRTGAKYEQLAKTTK